MANERSIPAFFLGGLVPKAQVGDVLEALYLSQAAQLDIAPLFDGGSGEEIAPRRISQRQPLPTPHQPTPPKQIDRPKSKTHLKAFLQELVFKHAPISHDDLIKKAIQAGYPRSSILSRLVELRRDKLVIRSSNKLYRCDNNAAEKPKRKQSIKDIILKVLRKAHPRQLAFADLKKIIDKAGRNGTSGSVTINQMKKDGLIIATPKDGGRGFLYQYNPHPN